MNGSGTPIRTDDPTGGQPGCGYSGYIGPVYTHHICVGGDGKDPCGSFVYP